MEKNQDVKINSKVNIYLDMGTKISDYTTWGSNSTIFVSSHAKRNWKIVPNVERLCLGRGLRANIHILIHISISEFGRTCIAFTL